MKGIVTARARGGTIIGLEGGTILEATRGTEGPMMAGEIP
jgi:hypothetical protein